MQSSPIRNETRTRSIVSFVAVPTHETQFKNCVLERLSLRSATRFYAPIVQV